MATHALLKKIAMELPDVTESEKPLAYFVEVGGAEKQFVWSWKERLDPKKPRVENRGVLGIRVANVAARDAMIAMEPKKFFTEPHYANYPAVLARLKELSAADLRVLLGEAHAIVKGKDKSKRR
jgi:hypothetical protein